MALTAQNSPLVNGAEFDLKRGRLPAKPGRLRVVRAFCIAGQRQEVGDIVTVEPSTASELITAGKLVREPVPPAAPPPEEKPTAAKSAAKE